MGGLFLIVKVVEVVVACLKLLSLHLPENTGLWASGTKIESRAHQIRRKGVMAETRHCISHKQEGYQ